MGLRNRGDTIVPVQTKRRGVAGSVRGLLRGATLPAASFQKSGVRAYEKVLPPPSVYVPKILSGLLLLKTLLLTVSWG